MYAVIRREHTAHYASSATLHLPPPPFYYYLVIAMGSCRLLALFSLLSRFHPPFLLLAAISLHKPKSKISATS